MLHPFLYVIDCKRALSFGEAQHVGLNKTRVRHLTYVAGCGGLELIIPATKLEQLKEGIGAVRSVGA
jgi:hypothetical protein